ncbi:MAG: hypothetical protein A2Y12_03690 [Planctomycetes bacterium GWF2_42_9]|nr:MAG: hypothetical protein A2Y12_03690 [Planctomycetes bacterium GWF2_42_9]
MQGFSVRQTGKVGDITAGLPPADYAPYPYLEWYSDENGRVVLELQADQVKVVGQPIPAIESDPMSREEQKVNILDFLSSLGRKFVQSDDSPLLTPELRQRLPKLYSQEHVADPVAQTHFHLLGSDWR